MSRVSLYLFPILLLIVSACSPPADRPAALQPTLSATRVVTSAPAPSATPLPPTPTPAEVRNFFDFSLPSDTWVLTDTEVSRAEMISDTYVVTLKAADSYYVLRPRTIPAKDMRITALIQPQGDARAGLVVRFTATEQGVGSYYACWIDAGSLCGCLVSINDQWETVYEPAEHPAIRPGEPNRVELRAEGTRITLRVNDTEITSFENELVTEGVAGLYLENFKTPTSAVFDNIEIVVRPLEP